jgi:hypothetical protein
MTIQEMLEEIPLLSVAERKQLIHALVDSLDESVATKPHSILELEGLGAEIWEGMDAQEYVNQLRQEWDDRP